MKKKVWLIGFTCICLFMAACSEKEEQKNLEYEFLEKDDLDQDYTEELIIEAEYPTEKYGVIEPYGGEFYYDEETQGFYYHLDCFYLNSDFLYSMNDTLEDFYDEYLKQYQVTEAFYLEQGESDLPEGVVPYSELRFGGVQYVDNDYISLLFNDVSYMGGAHPYSKIDAVTLNRSTGEEVTAEEFLIDSNEEILKTVSDLMGLDVVATWEDVDFYLQEDVIVFFYRMPGYWEDVVLGR